MSEHGRCLKKLVERAPCCTMQAARVCKEQQSLACRAATVTMKCGFLLIINVALSGVSGRQIAACGCVQSCQLSILTYSEKLVSDGYSALAVHKTLI